MKVAKSWLKELVDLNISDEELAKLLSLRTVGTKEINNQFIELDMKGYNRADLLSLRGIAYEVGAITDSEIKFKETEESEFLWNDQNLAELNVEVIDQKLNPLYTLAKIEGVKVGPFSAEWTKKLEDSGMRSVNNIADITNLIMLEYGQPLHAFDAKTVKDEKIIVRTANQGEELETLDGKKRKLEATDLLITDPEKALGIAGVMGGKNSEITDSTTTILLEAAIFDPINLRKTATRLGLTSEASKRFQHGLTQKRLMQAFDAAIRMYQGLGGKLTGISIQGEYQKESPRIKVTQEKVNSLIGIEIDPEQVEDFLKKLHFVINKEAGGWSVIPPYWRLDIEIEEDVIEEITRTYGYEKIPAKELVGELPAKIDQSLFNLINEVKQNLVAIGFTEVQTYSYFSTRSLTALGFDDPATKLVKIANPISSETEYLRQDIWPNLLDIVSNNLNNFEDIAIFEIGKVYLPQEGERSKESYRLSLVLTNNTDNPTQELYQMFVDVLEQLNVSVDLGEDERDEVAKKLFHPTRFTTLLFNGEPKAGIAEIHPRILHKYGIAKRVAVIELNIEDLVVG